MTEPEPISAAPAQTSPNSHFTDALQEDGPPAPVMVPRRLATTTPPTAAQAEANPLPAPASTPSTASTGVATNLPAVVFNPAPNYPPELAAARIGGAVKLLVTLHADGRVARASVATSSGHARFDRAALEVIHRWRFTPLDARRPTVRELIVPVRFGIVD